MQILQGLQVVLADVDVAAQHIGHGIRRRQTIVGGVEPVIGEQLQLGVQCLAAIIGGPQRPITLLLVERLQAQLGGGVYLRGKTGADTRQLRQCLLQRGQFDRRRRGDRQWLDRQYVGCGDQWCNEQANAQVTCVFFEQ